MPLVDIAKSHGQHADRVTWVVLAWSIWHRVEAAMGMDSEKW